MIALTYGQAKTKLAAVAGDTGLPVTDARVLDYTNTAIQELMNAGEWPNVVDRWLIVAEDGEITLPTHLDRLMQVNLRGIPRVITSPWFQFSQYGPGTREDQCGFLNWWCDDTVILDRGEYPTKVSIPSDVDGPWVLRVYTAVDESVITDGTGAAPVCTIQGLDTDGLVIRSQVDGEWINGVQVAMDFNEPYVETTQEFSDITAFTKPVTNGYIKLTAWNGVTEYELSNYLFSDTTPSYHRYFSQWLSDLNGGGDDCLRTVRARCRKRFVPVAEDTDLLIISNLPALKEAVIAIWKRESDDYEGYAAHWAIAVNLMKAEAMGYRGKSRVPALTFQRGYGIGSNLPAIR